MNNDFCTPTGGRFGTELGERTVTERWQRGVSQQQSVDGRRQRGLGHNWRPGCRILGKYWMSTQ